MSSKWTTANIPDQTGRNAIVTGSNSGIGLEAARELVRKGATVTLAVRNEDRGIAARENILADIPEAPVKVELLDLADLQSIRSFAQKFAGNNERLDLLINNAGIMIPPYGKTKDEFETQFGTNHLGHFTLTAILFPLLAKTADSRIVNVSSSAHHMGRIIFEDLHWDDRRYIAWRAYGDSKIANLYFTYEMDRKLKAVGSDMVVTAAHPGWSATELQKTPGMRLMTRLVGQSAEMGALPTLMAATLESCRGAEYFGPSGLFEAWGHPKQVASNRLSHDEKTAQQLWQISEELTGTVFNI